MTMTPYRRESLDDVLAYTDVDLERERRRRRAEEDERIIADMNEFVTPFVTPRPVASLVLPQQEQPSAAASPAPPSARLSSLLRRAAWRSSSRAAAVESEVAGLKAWREALGREVQHLRSEVIEVERAGGAAEFMAVYDPPLLRDLVEPLRAQRDADECWKVAEHSPTKVGPGPSPGVPSVVQVPVKPSPMLAPVPVKISRS